MYPRPGFSLLPSSLAPIFGGIPVTPRLASRLGLPSGATLDALGAHIWDELAPEDIRAAAGDVISKVTAASYELSAARLPLTPHDVSIDALDAVSIESRPRNALMRVGYRDGIPAGMTVGRLAGIPHFGAQSLLDVATAIDAVISVYPRPALRRSPSKPSTLEAKPSPTVARLARAIARHRWASAIDRDDPRFGIHLRAIHPSAPTAKGLPGVLVEMPLTPGEAKGVARRLREFEAAVAEAKTLPLDVELDQILAAASTSDRDAAILDARLGLHSGVEMTLQQVGDAADITKERVRQIEKAFRGAIGRRPRAWMPALDRASGSFRDALPGTPEEVASRLAAAGSTPEGFPALAVLRAAETFGEPIAARLDDVTGLLIAESDLSLVSAAVSEARRLVGHWGTSTIDELSAQLNNAGAGPGSPGTLRTVIAHLQDFQWLDDETQWFWLRDTGRNRLLNQVAKIMSVAGRIEIGELREGVGRHHRMCGFRPPREILAELCIQSGLYSRRGDEIIGSPESLPDWRELLGDNERTIAEVLFEHGPVMRRDELEHLAVDIRGMNRRSFYVYLTYSPILARYAPGVYGLRGAPVSAAAVQALIPKQARTHVLQDHGWTPDGHVWIAYKTSAATVASGVVGAPGALKDVLSGSYELYSDDGDPVGTLAIGGNSIWGMSPFFRRRGVEAGDYIVLDIDLTGGRATIKSGTEEIVLIYQDAE